ncbi:MAG: peptide/nickel transport system ATP-binding protein [bacterium P3]|nr:MAG: peptide/nickel transport system ATP-binding protein [bacterium P3]KWW42299.1 MAG: peptide/nickel transport system ATP-binding protein [bacterium F083]
MMPPVTPVLPDSEAQPLLRVDGLEVGFMRDGRYSNVLRQVGFTLRRGHTLGIVGESGSGKSVTCMSVMRLLPETVARASGSIMFAPDATSQPVDLLTLSEQEMCRLRGNHISMIFQEPMTSLNPVHRCGDQVVEMLRRHENISGDEARQRVLELFDEVRLPRPEKLFRSYPHEISGGQKQRVMIAMALVCHPDLLIADEPTTALDVTVQRDILSLLRQLQDKYHIGVIFITHDLGVVAQVADEVLVMYRGEVVESGSADAVLHHPQHPYTRGLLACRPPLDSRPFRLPTVTDFLDGSVQPDVAAASDISVRADRSDPHSVLLSARDVSVSYSLRRNLFGKSLQELQAVDKVSFDIYEGETLGLVGESGCGKSTLGRALLRLVPLRSGQVSFEGVDMATLPPRALRRMRTRMQLVFQDPFSSLNPHRTIGDTLLEPLSVHRLFDSDGQRRRHVVELLERVGLPSDSVRRYPHEFSGGQRQRIVIARALALNPRLVVCDESVSALDVSVQAQVLNLLNDLKRQFGYTYLFITHDLSVVKFLSDRILVMQQGRIVEQGPVDELYRNPQTAYTKKLLEAIPRL